MQRLAMALPFLDFERVDFGRVVDPGELAQFARRAVLFARDLLRDLVKAVDHSPSNTRGHGGKAGIAKQRE